MVIPQTDCTNYVRALGLNAVRRLKFEIPMINYHDLGIGLLNLNSAVQTYCEGLLR